MTLATSAAPAASQALQNGAAGGINGVPFDLTQATVVLVRDAPSGAIDPGLSTVAIDPPVVRADGAAYAKVRITVVNAQGSPLAGRVLIVESSRGAADLITQPSAPTDGHGTTEVHVSSSFAGAATLTVTEQASGVRLSQAPTILFTAGLVLELTKGVDRAQARLGDVLTYRVELRNLTVRSISDITVVDSPPPVFRYLEGSAFVDGLPLAGPSPAGTLSFPVGEVPAASDRNGDGRIGPDEAGRRVLLYRMAVGAGARNGRYENLAVATDVCAACAVSNSASAAVEVIEDPLFELGTLIGKVFNDVDGDGWQDPAEDGIGGAMVALDDGSYVLTDSHGRYHFPAVRPGERLLKLNVDTLPPGAVPTGQASRIASVTEALLAKVNFGVRLVREVVAIGADATVVGADGASPRLVLELPPAGLPLRKPRLALPGSTDRGNRVWINDTVVEVAADGSFLHEVSLEPGPNELVARVLDQAGREGEIRRNLEYAGPGLFFMAIADTMVSQVSRSGNVRAAGAARRSEVETSGRLAFYLKGTVAGRYLLTSAFDSGRGEFGDLFSDLDQRENDRLLTNLDPDTLYPVYGDDSEIVFDAQSRGKFYLALTGEQADAIVGNYQLSFTETELAAYQRTLYGARTRLHSAASTTGGEALAAAEIFVAEGQQAPVRDEIRATGGSLYYLSHRDVIEGSEQVELIVFDQQTGLPLARLPQQRNVDYTVKYPEGRILFNRPVSSISASGQVIGATPLTGDTVTIRINYETRTVGGDAQTWGARARQKLADGRLTVGGTYISDEQPASEYQLSAADAELKFRGGRLVAEYAQSEGSDSMSFVSSDGGLTYARAGGGSRATGDAFRIATEFDVGELLGTELPLTLNVYYRDLADGFASNGALTSAGLVQYGTSIDFTASPRDTLGLRFDRREFADAGAASLTDAYWRHQRERLTVEAQLQDRDLAATNQDATVAAVKLSYAWSDDIRAAIGHQETLDGADDSGTSIEAEWSITDRLSVLGRGFTGDRGEGGELGLSLDTSFGRLYAGRRLLGAGDLQTEDTTLVGAEVPVGDAGRVFSEYQWGRFGGADGVRSLIGARRDWSLTEAWSALVAAEYTGRPAGARDAELWSIVGGLSFDDHDALRFSTRNEWRRQSGTGTLEQFVSVNQLEYRFDDDFRLLGKLRLASNDFGGGTGTDTAPGDFTEASLGLAYRPVANDRFNLLARITRLEYQPTAVVIEESLSASISDVLSGDWSWQLTPRLEYVGKLALRMRAQQVPGHGKLDTTTTLVLQRINIVLPRDFMLGSEYRRLSIAELDSVRTGWLAEIAWQKLQNLRIGIGYNFTDFSDSLLDLNDYEESGWFLRVQGTY